MTGTGLLLMANAIQAGAGTGTALPAPVAAVERVSAPAAPVAEEQNIIVTGTRLRGQVTGDIPPEVQLDAREVQAYGASNAAELLEALSPLTRSGRGRGAGRPIVLLNGRRVSSFAEIHTVPTEAIERVDILPEEVALRYGYRADQRVVNFVLKEHFSGLTMEADGSAPTAGGRSAYGLKGNMLVINPLGRWTLDGEHRHESPLFENERGILLGNGPVVDERPFRTLLAESDTYTLGGTFNRTVMGDVSATLNARAERRETQSFSGLARSPSPAALGRRANSVVGHLGLSFNGDFQSFRWALTGNFDRARSDSLIETDFGTDRAHSWTQAANAEFVASGPLFELPSGEVSTSLRFGAEQLGLRSHSTRAMIQRSLELSRTRGSGQASLDLPIASRRTGVLDEIGDLSINFNAEIEQLSDFGTLRSLGAGLNWSPIQEVRVIASVTDEDGAPSMQQLGDPFVLVPKVRIFDLVRGETVDVARIEGGNPDLLADNRRVWKVGLQIRPLNGTELMLRADYTSARIRRPIASFPAATAEIEAAFRSRFVREPSGRLIQIDSRPINLERSERSELRWGFFFSQPLGAASATGRPPPARQAGAPAAQGAAPGVGGGTGPMGAPGGAAAPGGRRQQSHPTSEGRGDIAAGFRAAGHSGPAASGARLNLALFHTWHFRNAILIREGVPVLDLLDGASVGGRGGEPRHQIEAMAVLSRNGLGMRINAEWQSSTVVYRDRTPSAGDLIFSDLLTVNLRLFANFNEQAVSLRWAPWLNRARIALSISNLFNSRLRVVDAAGVTPLSYQADLIDPLGRSITLSLRKQF
jgi:hypothetical protein